MVLKDLKEVLRQKDSEHARMLLQEFDDLISAQTRQPISNPDDLREAGKLLAKAIQSRFSAINGEDNRIDVAKLFNASKPAAVKASIPVANNSRAVALLADEELLTKHGKLWRLKTVKFGDAKELCPSERFFNHPISTPATAFLVRNDLVVTLRHNLNFFSDLGKIRVLFDFEMQDPNDDNSCKLEFLPQEIYEVIDRYSLVDSSPNAFVALRLSRPVMDRVPVVCNFGKPIDAGQPVYTIGHPCGLPKIYSDHSVVLDVSSADAFTADLDAFSGDSGSPIFNEKTGKVEGILVEGGSDDFQWIPNGQGGFCNFSITYQTSSPFGYKIRRIKSLQRLIGT